MGFSHPPKSTHTGGGLHRSHPTSQRSHRTPSESATEETNGAPNNSTKDLDTQQKRKRKEDDDSNTQSDSETNNPQQLVTGKGSTADTAATPNGAHHTRRQRTHGGKATGDTPGRHNHPRHYNHRKHRDTADTV